MLLSPSRWVPISLTSNLKSRAFAVMAITTSSSSLSPPLSSLTASELAPYLEQVKRCNRGKGERATFVPFLVDNVTVGYIHPSDSVEQNLEVVWPHTLDMSCKRSFVQHLLPFSKVFDVRRGKTDDYESESLANTYVTLHEGLQSQQDRTESVNKCLKFLSDGGIIPGWRDEMYPVVNSFGAAQFFSLERAAVPYFGTKAYGVHINGFSVDKMGRKYLWVARRSMTKQTFPGMLDHVVAGGQPVGLSCRENVIKECNEEAGIPMEIAERALPVSAVSYEDVDFVRLKRDVLFCYDLELPMDFKPYNQDGEVDSFNLLPISEVEKILRESEAYKPNCALVVIDFLIRHGYVTPDQTGYLQLFSSLRQGDCL
ncbi:hypothetical protein L7F22_060205 [Adiantum nelumboides]|nr:hypothetical protein [Adiantum nelumboides]